MKRGEIWWADDPETGRRPHLILTRDAAIPVLGALLAVPATRTIRDIPTEVLLGVEHGMPTDCALSLDNTTVVPKAFFTEPICTLDSESMNQVCRALAIATDCRP